MSAHTPSMALPVVMLACLAVGGCGGGSETPAPGGSGGAGKPATASDRVAIPDSVRSNLGITFVTVERRRVEETLRAPGRFELLPSARREYRTMLSGQVDLVVHQFEKVEVDAVLYRIDSPEWREMQQQLVEAEASLSRLTTLIATLGPLDAAHERHEESLDESISVWTERVAQLQSVRKAGGGRVDALAEARSALAAASADLAEVQETKAELDASRAQAEAELEAAHARRGFLLSSAASLSHIDEAELIASTEHGHPIWADIHAIEVRAVEAGVVESLGLTKGSWADASTAVVTVVKPDMLRFHASGLQSDMGVLHDGLTARIVPPTPTMAGRGVKLQDTMDGVLELGLFGDPAGRTIDLYVTPERLSSWARPGVTAQLEIVTSTNTDPELAIPLAAVQRDGIHPVIFRRDPKEQGVAIRLEADLGADDGRWVQVLSGLRDGDEVVLDGAFQLMLATSGGIEKGGHFHSDGTFHEGEDE